MVFFAFCFNFEIWNFMISLKFDSREEEKLFRTDVMFSRIKTLRSFIHIFRWNIQKSFYFPSIFYNQYVNSNPDSFFFIHFSGKRGKQTKSTSKKKIHVCVLTNTESIKVWNLIQIGSSMGNKYQIPPKSDQLSIISRRLLSSQPIIFWNPSSDSAQFYYCSNAANFFFAAKVEPLAMPWYADENRQYHIFPHELPLEWKVIFVNYDQWTNCYDFAL